MKKYTDDLEGAVWRKCDFHIHSKHSQESQACLSIEDIFKAALDKEIEMIAISDHSNFDGLDEIWEVYDKEVEIENVKYKYSDFVEFFPAVELKASLGKNGVHFIAMFPKYINGNKATKAFLKENFLAKINYSQADIEVAGDGDYKKGLFIKSADFIKAQEIIKNLGGIIIVHNGRKDHGFDSEISHEPSNPTTHDLLNSLGSDKERMMNEYIDVCEFPNFNEYHQEEKNFYLNKFNKPCILCSDSHSEYKGELFTWIKSDRTFDGVKQIICEPEDRVFIGKVPPVLNRVDLSKTKYIDYLIINKKDGYDGGNGIWFDNIKIKFNKELVAIIGNKGSGKSAIADIIGLLGNSSSAGDKHKNFSFLNASRFRKNGYANNFEAELVWEDGGGKGVKISLDTEIDIAKKEQVKYLPQSYFETITNDLSGKDFNDNLKNVIFLHIPPEKRLGKSNFDDLEREKVKTIATDLSILKDELSQISQKIIKIETKKHRDYKKFIESEIDEKERELESHKKNKPKEVLNPSAKTTKEDTENEQSVVLFNLNNEYNNVLDVINEKNKELIEKTKNKEEIQQIQSDVSRLKTSFDAYVSNNNASYLKYGLDIKKIIKSKFDLEPINLLLSKYDSEILLLNNLLKTKESIDREIFSTSEDRETRLQESIVVKRDVLVNKINKIREQLTKPERDFQEYKEKIRDWESTKKKIEGDENTPSTLLYLKNEKDFVENKLSAELIALQKERISKVKAIFDKKKEILDLYNNFKSSIDEMVVENKGFFKNLKLEIEAGFKLDESFSYNFLKFINKTKIGFFRGADESQIKEFFIEKNLLDIKDVSEIINSIMLVLEGKSEDSLSKKEIEICDQIENVQGFYDFLFSLDYLKNNYDLKLDGKTLLELSPGERGVLLLIFYLMIDKNEMPLIIDQPEDNLDNKSIFEVLANFIKMAKKRRQIIIVTHNPNLAVGADAEQIIYVEHDKKTNKFSYELGAIENQKINNRIVEVLEGTLPAFNKREEKYYKK